VLKRAGPRNRRASRRERARWQCST
jgi:hypothetical protein